MGPRRERTDPDQVPCLCTKMKCQKSVPASREEEETIYIRSSMEEEEEEEEGGGGVEVWGREGPLG